MDGCCLHTDMRMAVSHSEQSRNGEIGGKVAVFKVEI